MRKRPGESQNPDSGRRIAKKKKVRLSHRRPVVRRAARVKVTGEATALNHQERERESNRDSDPMSGGVRLM